MNNKTYLPNYIIQEIIEILKESIQILEEDKEKNKDKIFRINYMRTLLIKRFIKRG